MTERKTKPQSYKLEVCANTINSAISAEKGGAGRIELCTNILQGGTTPSYGTIDETRNAVNIDIIVLIRPREGDFIYSARELEIMKKDIEVCAKLGCQGIATGALTSRGTIDIEKNKALLETAKSYGMEATFHRAIDRTQNIIKSTEEIIEIGFDRILTSGGYPTVPEGMFNILNMNNLFKNNIIIMPGGGITPKNIREIASKCGSKEFHGTFSSNIETSIGWKNAKISDEKYIIETDLEKVKEVNEILSNINY